MEHLFPSTIHDPRSAIPASSITRPTTRYVGRKVPATSFAADRAALVPQHAHWPLVFMLVLTQAGIGLCGGALQAPNPAFLLTGTIIFYLGMAASVFHLGQPLKAWRFFLGLKTSWLSREILALSLFAPIPLLLCILPFLPDFPLKSHCSLITAHSALPVGILAVFTSVMIYHDTHRALWHFPRTAIRFFGTVAAFAALANPIVFASVVMTKLVPEVLFLRHASSNDWSHDAHSARLQQGPLRNTLLVRCILALLAIPAAFASPWLALPLLLAAEILERQLFFQSVQAPKMPGNFGPSVVGH
jgi:DMSO reductase anchor subunit